GTMSVLMSQQELSRWRTLGRASDLEMPPDLTRKIELYGTNGGVKLLPNGRKEANDYLKLALPGRFVIAVALREREDGAPEPSELELWLALIERVRARNVRAAFVILNCLLPSQQREWPAQVRFARNEGLTLQDAICLAQIADGYLAVLDIFGLAAHSAGRPGVYVPLDECDPPRAGRPAENSNDGRIMVGSRNRTDIETAVESFSASLGRLGTSRISS